MEILDLLKTAIDAVEAVRNHYEGAYAVYRYPDDAGPHPGKLIACSNDCLKGFRGAQHDIAVHLEKMDA